MNYGFQFQVHEKSIKNWKSLVESDEDAIAMVYWQERKGGKKHIITPVKATENGSVDQSGICNKSIHLFLEGRASWWNSYSWWWAMVYGRVTCSIKDDTKFLLPSIPPSLTVSLPFFLPSMLSLSLFRSNCKNGAAKLEVGENEVGGYSWSLERVYSIFR